MNFKRGYTDSDMEEMGFDSKAYEFPEGENEITVTLVMKKWTNKKDLSAFLTRMTVTITSLSLI